VVTVGEPVLRIVTLNIWNRAGDWELRRSVLRDGLAALRPDVIALQEAVVTADYDQAADLLGDEYTIEHQSGRTPDGVGASVASRRPIHVLADEILEHGGRMDPSAAWIGSLALYQIECGGLMGNVVFAHHKPTWQYGLEREREALAVAAARRIDDVAGDAHVVLAGDFDAPPDAASIRFWSGLQSLGGYSVSYQDAWAVRHPRQRGDTFTPRNPLVRGGEMPLEPGRRIDYIFVRCNDHGPVLEVRACDRLFDAPVGGVWASDHFGLVAELAVPAESPLAAPSSSTAA
jgi:endonuclease/exonuclease/phosphatase family metal-dependent hydrolase